jgi:hypothetical protein
VTTYFDFDDFEDPVKAYIEDRLYFPMQYDTKKGAEIFIKKAYT